MAYWLLKTEPDCYAWDDLVRDGRTTWDGIANALALKNLRAMQRGDLALVYHTGGQRQAVGVAKVLSSPCADPNAQDERAAVVDLGPKAPLARPVSLEEIKADPAFAGWDFLRLGRLSVVPVPGPIWERLMAMAATSDNPDVEGAAVPVRARKSRPKGKRAVKRVQ